MTLVLVEVERNIRNVVENNSYKPYNLENTKKYLEFYFPKKATKLLKDPVHLWRATTGLELIHKEPTKKEQVRIWNNWNKMTDEMKKRSDKKSIEFFGKTNIVHHGEIMNEWDKLKK